MNVIDQYKCRYASVMRGPVLPTVVDNILGRHNVKDQNYRQWLTETGGGPIGSDWYDGIEELEASQEKLKTESWSISGFVIGWDGAGNPIVLSASGEIQTEDHNFGGTHTLAPCFFELLKRNI